MATNRVQVQDLSAPEPIRPFGVQSDTFARPAQPAINNDWENLERGLAAFGHGVRQLDATLEHKKREDLTAYKERALEEYARFRLAKGSDAMANEWRSGTVPYQHDPIMVQALNKFWAQDEVDAFNRSLDTDTELHKQLGNEDFDVGGYVREKIKPHTERLYGQEGILPILAAGVDTTTERLTKIHEKALGERRTAAVENAAMSLLNGAWDKAIASGAPPTQGFADALRTIYRDLGPRKNGGVLSIPYGRQDELLLSMLKDKAEDPRYAHHVHTMLDAQRKSLDPSEQVLPPLAAIQAHHDKVAAIRKAADETLKKDEKRQFEQRNVSEAVAAAKRGDGSFGRIQDEIVPARLNGELEIKGEALKREAMIRLRDEIRTANSGQPDVAAELDAFAVNNVEHEEFFNVLRGGYRGLGNVITRKDGTPDPEGLQQIERAGALYMQMKQKAPNYTHSYIKDEKAEDFYEMFALGVSHMGLTPSQSAAQAMKVAAKGAEAAETKITPEAQKILDEGTRSLGIFHTPGINDVGSVWYNPWSGITNPQALAPLAKRIMRTYLAADIEPKEAAKLAAQRVNEQAVVINGKAFLGIPDVEKDKEPALYKVLDSVWAKHGRTIRASTGAEGPEDLSFSPVGRAYLQIVGPNGMAVVDDKGHEIHTTPDMLKQGQKRMADHEALRTRRAVELQRQAGELPRLHDLGPPGLP
jgi:hypothetical protein